MEDKDIIKALECCLNLPVDCGNCAYTKYPVRDCNTILKNDIADIINRRVAENEMLKRKLAMAKEGLKHTCITCFYMETPSQEVPCRDCRSFNKWKWRGDEDDSE